VNRVYWQRDPLWAGEHLGYDRAARDSTMGKYGCAVCCVAMLLNESKLPEVFDPVRIDEEMTRAGLYRGASYNLVDWPNLYKQWSRLVYRGRFDCPNRSPTGSEFSEIISRLRDGMAVVLYVDSSKREDGLQQHFVLAAGIGELDTDIWIADPWFGDFAPLIPRYGRTVTQAICGAVLYDYTGAAPNPDLVTP
jgi:hypothetical protein